MFKAVVHCRFGFCCVFRQQETVFLTTFSLSHTGAPLLFTSHPFHPHLQWPSTVKTGSWRVTRLDLWIEISGVVWSFFLKLVLVPFITIVKSSPLSFSPVSYIWNKRSGNIYKNVQHQNISWDLVCVGSKWLDVFLVDSQVTKFNVILTPSAQWAVILQEKTGFFPIIHHKLYCGR